MKYKLFIIIVLFSYMVILYQIRPYYKAYYKENDVKPPQVDSKLQVIQVTQQPQVVVPAPLTTTPDYKNYVRRYPFLLACGVQYQSNTKHNEPVETDLYEQRVTRAVLFYFPTKIDSHFMKEFQWVYRSWIEMEKYEPIKWRTDLIIFIDNNMKQEQQKQFEELNCSFNNKRLSREDKPMCTLLPYVAIGDRQIPNTGAKFSSTEEEYEYLYAQFDIFNHSPDNLIPFYRNIQTLRNYGYVDSILMAFDGYQYLKDKYDFLVRSDMDVFLTPLFSKWLPKKCNDFVVGGGGYSDDFNVKKLKRIAKHLNLKFNEVRNLGSTWYSTPAQFCLVSYLTLISMSYISNEEFSQVERRGGIGVLNWPEWHYGVLLLYGQNLALNHLIASQQGTVLKYPDLIDFPSGGDKNIFQSVHIHVFHGDNLFSKFMFYAGRYDNMTVSADSLNSTRYYCLHMALESKRLQRSGLLSLAIIEGIKKI